MRATKVEVPIAPNASPLALGDPHQRTHRIAHGHRLDKVFEILVPSISVIGQRPPP
jgi:hypothetical protein